MLSWIQVFEHWVQTSANRGLDSRFILEAIIKALISKSSRCSILKTHNYLCPIPDSQPDSSLPNNLIVQEHVWDQLFTVDTIWNIGETGDMHTQLLNREKANYRVIFLTTRAGRVIRLSLIGYSYHECTWMHPWQNWDSVSASIFCNLAKIVIAETKNATSFVNKKKCNVMDNNKNDAW